LRRGRKIGIALSGGAARGLSHIGVLEVLQDLGVEASAIAGTSMGSIVGSFLCSGISLEEMQEYVESMDWRSFLLFSDLALSNTGIINGRRVERQLKKFLKDKTFEDCSIDFCCVAVDIFSREKVVLTRGRLLDAVRASISIPGFFSPVHLDGRLLVDGGIIEPLPTEAIKVFDLDFVIGSSITFTKDNERYRYLLHEDGNKTDDMTYGYHKVGAAGNDERFRTLLESLRSRIRGNSEKTVPVQSVLDTSLNIMHREMTSRYNKLADIIIEPEVGDFGFFDLTRGKEIIQRGREAAEAKADEIKKKLGL